jgi:DNA-binding MarR family transcriptional regulator
LEKSWSSRIVDGLVRDDLVMKVPHPTDGRSSLLTLTPKGEARFAALNENLNAHADRVLERIPADARPGVRHALQLLRDALRAEEDPTCAVPSLHKENHP